MSKDREDRDNQRTSTPDRERRKRRRRRQVSTKLSAIRTSSDLEWYDEDDDLEDDDE